MKFIRFFVLFLFLLFFAPILIPISYAVGPIPDTDELHASWSPDGQNILFVSYGVMSEGEFLIKPDGSEIQKIRGGIEPSWSPDGNIIMINIFNGNRDIVLMDTETQNITRLTHDENFLKEYFPKYSPDGKEIVFSATNKTGDDDIYILNLNANVVYKITDGESAHIPDFSPDSKFIAYLSYKDRFIHITTSDGKENKKIIDKKRYDLSSNFRWTPDSKYLLLNNGSNTITKVNIDDPTDIEYIYDPAAHWDPEYSPDGNYVTFVSNMDGGNPDLFVARSNGSDLYRLVMDTNPKFTTTDDLSGYFHKISRPTPVPTPIVTPTASPTNTSAAGQTPSVPGFSALAVFVILVSLALIKRRK